MSSFSWCCLCRLALAVCLCFAGLSQAAAEPSQDLQVLRQADTKDVSQAAMQQAWNTVATTGTVEQIPQILAAMRGVGPLSENWLRAAVDTIAEREIARAGKLPVLVLEEFIRDLEQAPRARRVAYQWLTQVDTEASERLLPEMLDDPSLELRYDALARLLDEAEATDDEQLKLKKYQRALRSARDKGQLRTCAEALEELGQAPDMAQEMGFLTTWKVIGPFDNTDRAGFNKVYPAEALVDLAGEYAGKHGNVKWIDVVAEQADLDDLGVVDFNAALEEEKSVLAYAVTTFVAAKDLVAQCRYESKEATKLWVNGEQVAVKNVYHSGGGFDQYIVPCRLKQGENQILIKVCQNEQTQPWTKPWDFRLRVTDKLGGAIQQAK